jgi:MscS family membrane protein
VAVYLLREVTRRTGSTLNDMVVPVANTSLKLTVVLLAGLQIAEVLSNQPPSSLIAGLGIGGFALGLAAQDSLKNFFGSMMIFADQPFELGDRIVIDGHDGPVEGVGFRSTRIRTLEGHLVTVPNAEMASRTILNIGKRPYIRRVMNVRLAYDTPAEKVERALAIIRQTLAGHKEFEESRPPRVFLDDFLDAAMNIKAFYWYHPPDYWAFCDFNERVNLEIIKQFKAEKIRFALPSQTLFLADDPRRPGADLSRPDRSTGENIG